MNEERAAGGKSRLRALLIDTAPLRESPAFARLWAGTSIGQIGAQLTIVAVGLNIFDITRSTFAVSLVALWALGPMIVAGFLGGALADSFDRRRVALVTAVVAWLSIGTITLIAFLGVETTWPYYALSAVNAASATIMGTARGAMLPRLVGAHLLPAASALQGITMGLAITVGPALAGVLVAAFGFAPTYLVDAVLFTASFLGIASLPPVRPEGAGRGIGLSSVADSLRFLRHAPNVRATFLFDIAAMTLGHPRVVFPAASVLVLGGGPVTVGALTSSFAVGALLSSLVSGPLGAVRRQGRAVTLAIMVFGACTVVFGVDLLVAGLSHGSGGEVSASRIAWPALIVACIALAGMGAADNVSAIFRNTILQVAAPDDVRGRMQGIFSVVVAGGPRIGDLIAGGLATLVALWAPPLFGGIAIVLIMCLMLRTYRSFQQYDALNPTP